MEGPDGQDLISIAMDCPAGSFTWSSADASVATVAGHSNPNEHIATVKSVGAGTTAITVTFGSASDTATVTVVSRNYVLVFGDQGRREHNLGALPALAAQTHEREIRANTAPGVPKFGPADKIIVTHISTVTDLVNSLSVNNVVYLAYFGHSWNEAGKVGALFIGQDHAADSNLTIGRNPPPPEISTNTPPSALPVAAFRSNATVRLFGCRGAFGADSIAEQVANHLHREVFGFDNSGGSIFTNDPKLGHGERSATAADLSAKVAAGKDIWMIPADGTPHFRKFGP